MSTQQASQGDTEATTTTTLPAPTSHIPPHSPTDAAIAQASREAQQHQAKARELGLNFRQERFAYLIIQGKPQVRAYNEAGYESSGYDISASNASTLVNNQKVKAFIDYLRAYQTTARVLSRQRKREILNDLAEDEKEAGIVRIQAIKTDNQMTGDDAPIRIEGEITLTGIMKDITPSLGLPSEEEAFEL